MLSALRGPPLPRLARVGEGEHRGQDREVLGDVVCDREGRERAAGDQLLLCDLDDLDQLGRVRVEVDHVAGLLGGGGAGVHRNADICLSERRGVVGAVARHRDHPPLRLLLFDQRHLRLRGGLCEEVVDARLLRDHGGGDAVVAGDHHGADAHAAELVEALVHAALDDVFEVNDSEREVVLRNDQRRAAGAGDLVHLLVKPLRDLSALFDDPALDRLGRTLPVLAPVHVDAAHPGGRGERDECRVEL